MIQFSQLIDAINDAAIQASSSLKQSSYNLLEEFFEQDENGRFSAKSITLNYPEVDDKGTVRNHEVVVPLITMMNLEGAKIKELKFATDLEIHVDNADRLFVSFPGKKGLLKKSTDHNNVAHIEIIVEPQENAEGLEKLIEGYEKVLRSQIPG